MARRRIGGVTVRILASWHASLPRPTLPRQLAKPLCYIRPGNGILVLFFRVVVGLSAGSDRHHPLHPPPPRFLLALRHHLPRLDRRGHLYLGGNGAGREPRRQSFKVFPRRRRIRELQTEILDNPAAGN